METRAPCVPTATVLPAEPALLDGIMESRHHEFTVLSPASGKIRRRLLHVNSYGGQFTWERIKRGLFPSHQLLGCVQLAQMGYEVALAEPLAHFNPYRHPVPHDLRLLRPLISWLGKDGILFSGHTLLYWLPILKSVGLVKCPIVSLLYARDDLHWARMHAGILSLTPAGAEHARALAPKAKVANLGWGVDLDFFPRRPYSPESFLSCGIAFRDFPTMCEAARMHPHPMRVICPGMNSDLQWPDNVEIIDGGAGWLTDRTKTITPRDLVEKFIPHSTAVLIVSGPDEKERGACGFTNLMEAMAASRPVIVTRTGALPGEIDVEKTGCGLYVPPQNPRALAEAMTTLAADPQLAESMGERGRDLVETRYNIKRYARDLHAFFESL